MLDRKWLIHCCKDKTISWRTRDMPIFNGVAIPVYSVETQEEAEALAILCCRKQYKEHPQIPGKPWYKITLDGKLDFQRYLEYDDIAAVATKLDERYQLMKLSTLETHKKLLQDKINDDVGLYMRYLGILQLLGDVSAYLPREGDLRDQVVTAMEDAANTYGLRISRAFNYYNIESGEE